MGKALFQPLDHLGLAGHAAAQADNLPRVAAIAVNQRADVAEHPLVGMLAHGAGVDDDHVRVLAAVGHAIAALRQQAADALGVVFVLLAAIGVHPGQRLLPPRLPIGLNLLTNLPLRLQRLLGDGNGMRHEILRPARRKQAINNIVL